VSMSRHVSSSALLLSHEAASYSQKVTDNRISQDSVQALIAGRLDYCNNVFHRISADNLQALQSVLNAGA